ncbi:MAG: hypothetical protein V2A56_09155 [bacterium]
MSEIPSPSATSWMELAQEKIDDQVNQVIVETKVALQLEGLRWQATNLGIGAQVVEHTLGKSGDEKNNDKSWPSRVGRVLDRYL